MACFHPIEAWQKDDGTITFTERGKIRRALWLPCQRCIGCRIKHAQGWATRCMHESQMHQANAFITLTYDERNWHPSLRYRDYQQFMYRVRQRLGPTRFFMCGEYGEENLRPHFHALLFGRTFDDAGPISKDALRSKTLEQLWPHGYSSWGAVTWQSAGYVAGYALKKITGPPAEAHYQRLDPFTGEIVQCEPEFARMSLKPGIGHAWFQKYWREVYEARDGIVQPGGKQISPPRYYDKLLEEVDHELKDVKDFERYQRAAQFAEDCTHDRLVVRERCAKAKQKFLNTRHL